VTSAPAPAAQPAIAAASPPAAQDRTGDDEQNRSSLKSHNLGNELLLANSSFKTYEFEAALADIASDVSGVWSEDDESELEDDFPYRELFQAERNA
jgi:hypothetical protein